MFGKCSLERERASMESEEGFSEDIANPMKRRYSRSELESLRFAGVDYQRRLWDEVYQRLGSVVAGEFDCLRHPKQQPQRKPKKKEPPITFCTSFSFPVTKIKFGHWFLFLLSSRLVFWCSCL